MMLKFGIILGKLYFLEVVHIVFDKVFLLQFFFLSLFTKSLKKCFYHDFGKGELHPIKFCFYFKKINNNYAIGLIVGLALKENISFDGLLHFLEKPCLNL